MVTLIGEGITVDELAHHFGTIGYELLTSLGRRYARIYKGGAVTTEPAPLPSEPSAAKVEPPVVKTEPPPIPT
jgi:alanine racemase